jgi:hypothetical protein
LDEVSGFSFEGNGQYYDPSTGRFLTRHAKPDNTNPYVPWNPSSALFAPLALLFLLYGNKRKRSKWDTLVIMLLLGVAVTMSLAACGGATPTPGSDSGSSTPVPSTEETPQTPANQQTPTPEANGGTATANPGAPLVTLTVTPTYCTPTASVTPTVTGTSTYTPTPTPVSLDAELELYGVKFDGELAQWTDARRNAVKEAVIAVSEKLAKTVGGTSIEIFKTVYYYSARLGARVAN